MVGRCADDILRRQADCLRVFVHAPLGFRVQRIAQVYDERQDSPEKRLQDKDRRRAAYYKFYTEARWGLSQNHHLAPDSGAIGIERCAEPITSLY